MVPVVGSEGRHLARFHQSGESRESFVDPAEFRKTTGDILRALRASTKAPGKERIYTCGEKEHLVWQDRKDKGAPVDAGVQRELVAMRDELGLPYTFPFE